MMAAHAVQLRRLSTSSCLTTTQKSCSTECHREAFLGTPSILTRCRNVQKGDCGRRAAVIAARGSQQNDQPREKAHDRAGRREVLLAGAAALVASSALPGAGRSEDAPAVNTTPQVSSSTYHAETDTVPSPASSDASQYGYLKDNLNAYEFKYPLQTAKKKETLPWVETRAPERYSSAAPISSDARQRIVSERIDFTRSITCTVSIGPPSDIFLKGADPTEWKATAVANSVLMDRSSRRMSQGQRTAESEIEEAQTKTVDGIPYFFYEHIQQRSPTTIEKRSDTFRHSYAVTAERDGYLYTLNISAPDVYWDDLEPAFRQAVESFRLLPPTKEYVPPWKDPWRFW